MQEETNVELPSPVENLESAHLKAQAVFEQLEDDLKAERLQSEQMLSAITEQLIEADQKLKIMFTSQLSKTESELEVTTASTPPLHEGTELGAEDVYLPTTSATPPPTPMPVAVPLPPPFPTHSLFEQLEAISEIEPRDDAKAEADNQNELKRILCVNNVPAGQQVIGELKNYFVRINSQVEVRQEPLDVVDSVKEEASPIETDAKEEPPKEFTPPVMIIE